MKCPLIKKECIKDKCAWWGEFGMKEVATGKVTKTYSCIVVKLPSLMIEQTEKLGKHTTIMDNVKNRLECVVDNGTNQNKIFAGMVEMSRRKSLGDST